MDERIGVFVCECGPNIAGNVEIDRLLEAASSMKGVALAERHKLLCSPLEYVGDERGMVRQVRCQEMELGEPDDSGRRRPVPKEGAEFTLDTDLVIVAIGSGANPLLTQQTKGLDLNRRGYIVTNEAGRTTREGVWAGGDIVTGSATVILAMGAGRTAAKDIHDYLSGKVDQWAPASSETPG